MTEQQPTALIVGASRGLGVALAAEFLNRGWRVIGTVRGTNSSELHDLADGSDGRLEIETLDMTVPAQLDALHERLAGRSLDLLFVNGGINQGDLPSEEESTESFTEVMVTNALSPMRVIGSLRELVPSTGTIGVMSSRQGSIAANTNGGYEVYRASKSALNQLMRSYAARNADDPRALLLINPGWVQTNLGGPDAILTADQSIPGVVDTILAHQGEPGLQFLDYENQVVPW